MKSAVLLLAHGAPERIEDVERYLAFVRGGQAVSPRVLEEVTSRYAAIGGSSPLTRWTRTLTPVPIVVIWPLRPR